MIERTLDKSLINSFLTNPDILPQFFEVKGDPAKHQDVIFLVGKVSLFVCIKRGKSLSCHAAVPQQARGKAALNDARDAIQWVFSNTDCDTIKTRADKTKKHLLHFNARLFNRSGEDEKYIYYEVKK